MKQTQAIKKLYKRAGRDRKRLLAIKKLHEPIRKNVSKIDKLLNQLKKLPRITS